MTLILEQDLKAETRRKKSMKDNHLTPEDLADRWKVPLATLSQWRWNGKGPYYIKLGRHIVYPLEDVELFEEQKRRRDTTCSGYATQPR